MASPTRCGIRQICVSGDIVLDAGRIANLKDTEVAMNKMMLRFPNSFGEAVKQVFAGTPRVASPDLQNLSDKALEDVPPRIGMLAFPARLSGSRKSRNVRFLARVMSIKGAHSISR